MFPKLHEIIKTSDYVRPENPDHDRNDNIEKFYILENNVKVGNTNGRYEFVIAEDSNGNKFYVIRDIKNVDNQNSTKLEEIIDTNNITDADKNFNPQQKIEDFGEKLEGAKKDLWKDYQKIMSDELPEDAKDITLAKHFPKPNYELMIEQGISVENLAIVQTIRDLIPNKPSIPHRLNSWGKTVKIAHSLANEIINSKLSTEELMGVIKGKGYGSYEFRNILAKAEMYIELGYPAFTVPNKYNLVTFTSAVHSDKVLAIYNKYKGQVFNEEQAQKRDKEIADIKAKYPSEKKTEYAITEGRIIIKSFDTREKSVNYLRDILIDKAENKQPKNVKLDIYQIRATKEIIIGKNVFGRKYIDLKSGFETVKEAKLYLKCSPELGQFFKVA